MTGLRLKHPIAPGPVWGMVFRMSTPTIASLTAELNAANAKISAQTAQLNALGAQLAAFTAAKAADAANPAGASTVAVNNFDMFLLQPGFSFFGLILQAGTIVTLTAQTVPAQNGRYQINKTLPATPLGPVG